MISWVRMSRMRFLGPRVVLWGYVDQDLGHFGQFLFDWSRIGWMFVFNWPSIGQPFAILGLLVITCKLDDF